MPLIRISQNVPETYVNQSRDFQLIARLYDCVVNGVKYDIDSMISIVDTSSCNNILLQLLQTKLGFFTNITITDEDLRYVLDAFPIMLKNKGSRLAIQQAVNVFMKINHMKTGAYIEINNAHADQPYTIKIGIESQIKDTSILDAILKYVMPTGYEIYYFFYTGIDSATSLVLNEILNFKVVEDPENSQISLPLNTAREYIIGASYHKNDIITAGGNYYVCIEDHVAQSTIPPSDKATFMPTPMLGLVGLSDILSIVEGYYDPSTHTFYSNKEKTVPINPIVESYSLYYHDQLQNKFYVYVDGDYTIIDWGTLN